MKGIGTNIKRIAQSDLAKNSAKLLSANFVAQIIGLLVYPLLTRLYTPEDFGIFNLFISIGGILALIATAEYQYAIVLPKTQKDAVACFQIGFFLLVGVSIICAVSTIFSQPIAVLFKATELANYYPLIWVFVFFSGLWFLFNYWYTRNKRFSYISTYQLTQSVSNSGLKYGLGVLGFLRGGLVWSSVIGPIIALLATVCTNFKQDIVPLFSFDKQRCRTIAKTYLVFPKFSLPRALINNFSGNLPILILTPFFGTAAIGFFGMAITLAFRPINMISGSFYQVFFQRTAEKINLCESIAPFFRKYLRNILLIVFPTFTLLYFILPPLTSFFLGSEWRITGEYIQLMLPWLAMSILVAPICYLADIFQKQKIGLLFEIGIIASRLLGLVVGIYYNSFKLAIAGYCFCSAIFIFAQLLWLLSLVKNYEKRLKL